MKAALIALALLVAVAIGVQQHDNSFKLPVSEANAQDSNCQFVNDSNNTGDRTKHLNGYNVCLTADYMARLHAKRPYPQTKITDSIELRNLTEKLLRFNDAGKIAYVTLLTPMGQIVAQYTIQGKVSSNQSSITATQQCSGVGASSVCLTSPGDDGSYGENEPGIFFFTTAGVMVQWNGPYLLTDAPQQVTTSPIVTYNVADKPTSAIDIGK